MIDLATLARLDAVDTPGITPDGSLVVFGMRRVRGDRVVGEAWVCGADGLRPRRILEGLDDVSEVRLAPTGDRVCAVSTVDDVSTLWVADLDGDPRPIVRVATAMPGPIASGANGVEDPAWSSDGGRIAFVEHALGDGTARPAYAEGSELVLVVRDGGHRGEGVGLQPLATRQVRVVDVATGGVTELAFDGLELSAPSFSPDGASLATLGRDPTTGYRSHVVLFDLAGSAPPEAIGPPDSYFQSFAWSPDGERIAILGNLDGHASSASGLLVYDLASGELAELDELVAASGGAAEVEPDEVAWPHPGMILVNGDRRGRSAMVELDPETGRSRLVAHADGWQSGLDHDREASTIVQVRESVRSTGELVVVDRSSGTARVVSAPNEAAFADGGVGPPAVVVATSDGFEIEATVLRPDDAGDGRLPTVFAMHGGPAWAWGGVFVADAYLLAARGYQVVMPNVRGSTGFGKEFEDAERGDYGGGEFRDLMAVVDLVCADGTADPDRLGIMGASHGGYLAAWAIGQTPRFRAAVCACPVVDLAFLWGTHDSGTGWGDRYHRGPPWHAREHYTARSPSTHAHRATTPTLVVQGLDDQRCPPAQAEYLFTILRTAGCETRLVLYPGVGHELAWLGMPPPQREDYLGRVASWFDDHLGV